jgi:hypothetical protein
LQLGGVRRPGTAGLRFQVTAPHELARRFVRFHLAVFLLSDMPGSRRTFREETTVIPARLDNRIVRWTFTRGFERLDLDRVTPTEVIVTFSGASPQVMKLADIVETVLFQTDLETELVRTGWTLTDFQATQPADQVPQELLAAGAIAAEGSV